MTITTYDVKQPLIAGSVFVFAAVLFQRANSQLIQTSPTLAAGDVKISIDGGGYTNIATLPSEVGTTGELIVSLSGAETTGALKYISVKFADVAGAEWCDVIYVIDVEEAKVVSNYAGGDTAGVTTMLADYARRTGDYATVAAVAAIFAVVDTEVADIKAKTDQLVFTIANQVDANALTTSYGPGAAAYTITINDNGGLPIDGVNVWITTDIAGANVIFNGYTNALGVVSPMLDAGNYYAWKQKAGYTFTNPQAFSAP